MSLPNWNDLKDVERAIIRLYDKYAEELFKKVENGKCPNLSFVKGKAKCLIYKNRFNFCKAFVCRGEQKIFNRLLKGGIKNDKRKPRRN